MTVYNRFTSFFLGCLFIGIILPQTTCGFIAYTASNANALSIQPKKISIFMADNSDENETGSEPEPEPSDDNVVIEDLSWRVAKARLEEENRRRFLKRKPIKLSYEDSRKWIQRNWAIKTKEEFNDLVANGNLRTPYISKRPEEYYGERGEWVSWDHYLLGNSTDSTAGGRQSKWQ